MSTRIYIDADDLIAPVISPDNAHLWLGGTSGHATLTLDGGPEAALRIAASFTAVADELRRRQIEAANLSAFESYAQLGDDVPLKADPTPAHGIQRRPVAVSA